MASLPTRLKPFEPREADDLVSWGYFVCDVALRSHYDTGLPEPIALPRDSN
jgi:NTE family protein